MGQVDQDGSFKIQVLKYNLNTSEFFDKYFDPEVPVIIKNISNNWPASERWGNGYLSDKLNNDKSVSNRGIFFTTKSNILNNDYQLPTFIQDVLSSDNIIEDSKMLRFWINKRNNKTEFHYDTNAENVFTVQIIGRKEWILVSPETPLPCYPFTNFTIIAKHEKKLLHRKKYCKFTLDQGDLLYIPPLWFHRAIALNIENININWTMTKRHTDVFTKAFKREIERCIIIKKLEQNKQYIIKNSYQKVIKSLPKIGGIGWGLSKFIKAPYYPNKHQIIKRILKELIRIPNAIYSIPKAKLILKKIDKT